jgi:hypothetical protein
MEKKRREKRREERRENIFFAAEKKVKTENETSSDELKNCSLSSLLS